jgi:hypothetical protein
MGRFKLDEGEEKKQINASVTKKILEKVGRKVCKAIAEDAVNKHYKKYFKS